MKAAMQFALLALLFVNWAAADGSDISLMEDNSFISFMTSNSSSTSSTMSGSSPTSSTTSDSSSTSSTTSGSSPTSSTTSNSSLTSPTNNSTGATTPPQNVTAPTNQPTNNLSTTASSSPPVPANTTTSIPSSTATSPPTSHAGPQNSCPSNPCGDRASCVSLYSTYVCLCMEGYYYNDSSSQCERGKIFPGEIGVQVSETSSLHDTNSEAYESLYNEVTEFFENALSPDYRQSVILSVRTSPSLSARSGARDQTVYVWIVNILSETTSLNETEVILLIKEAIGRDSNINSYSAQDRCDFYGCEQSDQDDCSNGLGCTCKAGMQRPNPLSPCVGCSEKCDAEVNKQCLQNEESGQLECVCLPGYQRDGNNNCNKCPFGYSGVNCTDQFELILTIVGSVAGILLLALVIVLIVLASSKNKKKDTEEQHLIDSDFHNLRLQQTGFSNFGADGSIFPKVKTVASKDLRAQNPYEPHRSMPRPDY